MRLTDKRSLLALSSVAFFALATPGFAQPPGTDGVISSDASMYSGSAAAAQSPAATRPARTTRAARRAAAASPAQGATSFGSSGLVSQARQYLGTNPTGRRTLWCGAFMDMVLKQSGHAGGGNLARGYARYGTRVAGPQVGAIAVMARGGGGHVGVVSGIDGDGNPIVISGNHNRTVAESTYPRSRIIAYVMPTS